MRALWTERYRPKTIDECVLPRSLKKFFQAAVDSTDPPQNMLFVGPPGTGKTTVLRAIASQKDMDLFFVNMSLKGNIDTLRTDIQQFASTVSVSPGGKIIGGDEFDYSNPQSTQPALRGMIEEFAHCRFVFTCNYPRRIIEPLRSRLTTIDFNVPAKEMEAMGREFVARIITILEKENVEYNKLSIVKLVVDRFPDYRKMIDDCQRVYNEYGVIDDNVCNVGVDNTLKELIEYMKKKNYSEVRKWVARNSEVDPSNLFRRLYESLDNHMTKKSVPSVVLVLGEYQYKSSLVADQEINTAACLAEIMAEAEWQ